MVIKIRLNSKKEWDKKIIDWAKGIPRGYLSTKVKEKLYNAITEKKTAFQDRVQLREEPSPHVDEKLSKFVKM